MRRLGAIIATAALAVFLAGVATPPLSAQADPFVGCDSLLNTPGLAMDCTVTVVNNLDLGTGVTSSVITYTKCTGAAGDALTCDTPVTLSATALITSVSQCNSSLNGAGATMNCWVDITNNIVGDATAVPVTINQCNGSLGGGGIVVRACTPDPASTSGANIDQCNDSDNGGGSSLTCDVEAGSTFAAALPVTVSQCNSSANGGGSLIVCSTAMRTNITPASGTGDIGGTGGTDAGSGERGAAELPATGAGAVDVSPNPALLLITIGALLLLVNRSRAGRSILTRA